MKKYLSFAVTAMAILGLGSLTSCHDEDFDVSTAVLQERAFEHAFINEFGKPSENQSWDFYSQKLHSIGQGAGMTRATQEVVDPDFTLQQPKNDAYFNKIVEEIGYALEEQHDNSDVGQNGYDLISTGDFKIYAVRYAGSIEVQDSYAFELGYIDDVNKVEVPLFHTGFRSGYTGAGDGDGNDNWGNPGWAAEVFIPEGASFIFYLRYTANGTERTFYTNQVPSYSWGSGNNTRTRTYDKYGGTSTLLYSAEHIDEATGKDEQVMMIGFEDGWALQNNYTHNPDYDFNDVVLLIEGKLPVPTAKRFFCEDKKSLDWDYNDVVFDVSSTGIVLRAVGGEQPVFLRVTDRLGHTEIYGELHELMLSLQQKPQTSDQPDNRLKKVTYKRMKDGEMKTFYKSIDVSAYEITGYDDRSVWLDPVQIARWTNLGTQTTHTRLNPTEVEQFSVDESFPGKVELIVLDEWAESYNKNAMLNATNYPDFGPLDPDTGTPYPIITDGGYQLISLSPAGTVPAMFIAPVSTKWVKELQKITLGYQNFYGKKVDSGTTTEEGAPIYYYWYETAVNTDKLYTFLHDEPDDEEEEP